MGIWYNHGVHCTFMHWAMLLLSLMAVLMGFIVLSYTGDFFYHILWHFLRPNEGETVNQKH